MTFSYFSAYHLQNHLPVSLQAESLDYQQLGQLLSGYEQLHKVGLLRDIVGRAAAEQLALDLLSNVFDVTFLLSSFGSLGFSLSK